MRALLHAGGVDRGMWDVEGIAAPLKNKARP